MPRPARSEASTLLGDDATRDAPVAPTGTGAGSGPNMGGMTGHAATDTSAGDHPFARFLRIVGRGPRLSRSLAREEACEAMTMILDDAVDPAQVGGFLLVLRTRGETAAEVAGFVDAVRSRMSRPARPIADLDWPSYADRHRQQPWFVLAARLLAESGMRVLMHGVAGATDGYAPTRPALAAIGVARAASVAEAESHLARDNLVYIGLESFAPAVARLLDLRSVLGVRTVINSLARALNPATAPWQIQGVFHPPYRALHVEAARLLHQPAAAVFKGGGGEGQRNPAKACRVAGLANGEIVESDWPALLPGSTFAWRDEARDPERIAALWRGEFSHPDAEAAIRGTAAIVLRMAGQAGSEAEAQSRADALWAGRDRSTTPDRRAQTRAG